MGESVQKYFVLTIPGPVIGLIFLLLSLVLLRQSKSAFIKKTKEEISLTCNVVKSYSQKVEDVLTSMKLELEKLTCEIESAFNNEKFNTTEEKAIYGAIIDFAYALESAPGAFVKVVLWDSDRVDGSPASILNQITYPISTVVADIGNFM